MVDHVTGAEERFVCYHPVRRTEREDKDRERSGVGLIRRRCAPGTQTGFDGSASYSQSDSSATVSCSWSLLSGPSSVTFSNASSRTGCYRPDLRGLSLPAYRERYEWERDGYRPHRSGLYRR